MLLNNSLDTRYLFHIVFIFIPQRLVVRLFFPDKLRIGALVAHHSAVLQLDGLVGDMVKKITVMADDDHGSSEIAQKILQPADGLNIQMIGRLVEKEHRAVRKQKLRQTQLRTLSAAETADRHGEILLGKTQSQQRGTGAALVG